MISLLNQRQELPEVWLWCWSGGGDVLNRQDVDLWLAIQAGRVGEGGPGEVHDVHGDERGLQES